MVLGAFAAPASQAADQRSPASGNHAAPVTRFNAFTNLGHEGSGLLAAWQAAAIRPWAN